MEHLTDPDFDVSDLIDHIEWINHRYTPASEMKKMLVEYLANKENIELLVQDLRGGPQLYKISIWQGTREWTDEEIRNLYDEMWENGEKDDWYWGLNYE